MKFKYWKHRIASLRTELKILFVIALTSVLIIDIYLINIPEWFTIGAELGSLYYKICLGYITGLIFYFINVHLANEKSKVKTYKYINNKSAKIRRLNITLIQSLRSAYPVTPGTKFLNEEEEISYLSNHINPQSPFTLVLDYNITFPHWFAAIDFIASENKELTRDLLFIRESINSDVIEILTDIDDCIDNHINIGNGRLLGNSDLNVFSKSIIQYKNLSDKLITTINEKYKYYKVEYHENFRKNSALRKAQEKE